MRDDVHPVVAQLQGWLTAGMRHAPYIVVAAYDTCNIVVVPTWMCALLKANICNVR